MVFSKNFTGAYRALATLSNLGLRFTNVGLVSIEN